MRRLILQIVLVALIGVSGCSSNSLPSPEPASKKEEFNPPHPVEWKLENGLTVLFMEDHELPILKGSLYIPGGTFWNSPDLPPIIDAMGDELREGGAGAMSSDQLDAYLESRAISISSGFGSEFGTVSFSGLSAESDTVLSLVADIVQRPRFDPARLELWKQQQLNGIRRRKEDASTIGGIAFSQILFGQQLTKNSSKPSQTFGRVILSSDIAAITSKQLSEAWAQFVVPNGSYLVISGPFSRGQVDAFARTFFGKWKSPRSVPLATLPIPNMNGKPGVYFIKGPFAQAVVYAGHQGVRRLTDDEVRIDAFNEVFTDGAFNSRLFKEIRTRLGLAYVVGGGMSKGRQSGVNSIFIRTKGESVGDAIGASVGVLRDMQENDISADELKFVQNSIESSFVFNYSSLQATADRRAAGRLTGYPDSFEDEYLPRIRNVSVAEVREIARKYWHPQAFVIVVVGDDRAYNSLGKFMKNLPPELQGLQLQTLSFDERAFFEK